MWMVPDPVPQALHQGSGPYSQICKEPRYSDSEVLHAQVQENSLLRLHRAWAMWKTLEILHQWLGFWTALGMAMQPLTSCLCDKVCNVPPGAKASDWEEPTSGTFTACSSSATVKCWAVSFSSISLGTCNCSTLELVILVQKHAFWNQSY